MSTPSPHPTLDELAAGEIDDADIRVLQQLAQIHEALDPVPSGLVDRIQFGITLDALHAELAELQRSDELAAVRSDASSDVQTVTFTSSNLSTMVTITPSAPDRVRIDGWVAPQGGVLIELRIVHETLTTTADADGRFVFEDVPRGLGQFTLREPSGAQPPVVTPSIEL
jgi:hypothetical protein